jgi:poly(3-hydroxybutyrate) depolymerase
VHLTGNLARFKTVIVFLLLALAGCRPHSGQLLSATSQNDTAAIPPTLLPEAHPRGQIVTITEPHGTFHGYVPTTLQSSPDVVVLIHGTPGKDETAQDVARYYLQNWIAFAQERGVILIAPAFDDANFGSKSGNQALGGYRSLLGRNIGADEFVLRVVERYQSAFGSTDARFYLYGHSAGGQFVARFIVKHPGRVKGAVISAAATYPHPNLDVPWPYGLGEPQATVQWRDPDGETALDFAPCPEDYLAAARLPVTVVVGLNDLEWQPDRTGQRGNQRVAIARNWVQDMNRFAAQHGVESKIRLELIPNLGHSSIGLLPYSQGALLP